MMERERLVGEVRKHAQWMANDCSTLFRVRHDGLGNYGSSRGASELEMGGGHFLMMNALMNVLGLLAKVYLRLTAPDDFSTQEHREIVKESRALVADRLPELKTTVKAGWTE